MPHDAVLWAIQRDRVYDENVVVFAGASRISSGFSPSVFEDAYPRHEAVMLASPGEGAFATLEDLADDPDFAGTLVVSIMPPHILRRSRNDQASLVRRYHALKSNPGWISAFADRGIGAWFEEHLVFRSPRVDVGDALLSLTGYSALDEPYYIAAFADYSRLADYQRLDLGKQRRKRIRRSKQLYRKKYKPVSPKRFLRAVKKVQTQVEKIQARGGEVVFVRFPTSGKLWDLDQKYFPRSDYWDQIAAHTTAKTIHFRDLEAIRDVECAEYSHVDMRDNPKVTLAFAAELERLGVIER